MSSLEGNYPCLKDQLSKTGLSIQAQDRYPHTTHVDMRGEQKIYRDAKISGGITHFAASSSPVQIRRINRSLYWKKSIGSNRSHSARIQKPIWDTCQ